VSPPDQQEEGAGRRAGAVTLWHDIGMERKIEALRRLEIYARDVRAVEVRESHMSWVFLTERFAYKMKKPVKWDRLDFSTLALRHMQCENEVILNRRLAPAVYLGLIRMTCDENGRLHLGGQGEIVEWLVRMVRLPTERKLERLVEERRVHEHDLVSAMELLTRFYRSAPSVHMPGAEYRMRLAQEIEFITAKLLSAHVYLPSDSVREVAASLRAFVERKSALLEARAGRVIDAHGDLRPQHIYIGADPAIIDCLEFNRDLRLREPLDELSFLRLECDRLGDPRPGDFLIARYREGLSDPAPAALVRFYAAFRAYERAKLAIGHLMDSDSAGPAPADPGYTTKWRERALTYLRLAKAYGMGSRYRG
jgi:aminoglycoside phosphotransferase family enzyme